MEIVILAAIPFFFFLMGLELLISRIKKFGFYGTKDSITNLGSGILSEMNGLIATPFKIFVYLWAYNWWNLNEIFQLSLFTAGITTIKGIFTWVLGFLVADFLFYWQHRHSHKINLLWTTHIAHHSSEEFNLSVALRQSAFGFVVNTQYTIPSAFLGIPAEVYFTRFAINLVYQFWIHTRLVDKLGFLEIFMNTPSHHRVYHGRDKKYLDKNYGGGIYCLG